ncbi:MAG: A/G-specific adenine glycosylase [Oscillospiraceae bacterium]|nr:A/G-specific adenine glycosylase [Oscillospiraceae bacterium]
MTDRNILAAALPRIADWHASVRRDLPWRRSPTPYHVWISEIMLQQTRIEAVIPYYERFLAELPDVAALASVDDDRLMKLWEGLGYYSRARNLKKAAQQIIERFGGALPATAEDLRSLPGVGDYTAGAIASLAFHKPEPAVDGNVLRVLSRLLASKDDVMSPAVRKSVTAQLRDVYPSGERAALLTEGLMELGETVCIPNGEPLCDACPAAFLCRARAAGDPTQYPVRSAPKARRIEERTVLLLRCGGKYAIRRREEKGLLAGLWEFPSLSGALDERQIAALFPAALSIASCGSAKHIFTHVEWHMTGWRVELPEEASGYVWETAEMIRREYSLPTALKAYRDKL